MFKILIRSLITFISMALIISLICGSAYLMGYFGHMGWIASEDTSPKMQINHNNYAEHN